MSDAEIRFMYVNVTSLSSVFQNADNYNDWTFFALWLVYTIIAAVIYYNRFTFIFPMGGFPGLLVNIFIIGGVIAIVLMLVTIYFEPYSAIIFVIIAVIAFFHESPGTGVLMLVLAALSGAMAFAAAKNAPIVAHNQAVEASSVPRENSGSGYSESGYYDAVTADFYEFYTDFVAKTNAYDFNKPENNPFSGTLPHVSSEMQRTLSDYCTGSDGYGKFIREIQSLSIDRTAYSETDVGDGTVNCAFYAIDKACLTYKGTNDHMGLNEDCWNVLISYNPGTGDYTLIKMLSTYDCTNSKKSCSYRYGVDFEGHDLDIIS